MFFSLSVRSFSGQTRRSLRTRFGKTDATQTSRSESTETLRSVSVGTANISPDIIAETSSLISKLADARDTFEETSQLKRTLGFMESNKLRTPIRDICQFLVPLLTADKSERGHLIEPALKSKQGHLIDPALLLMQSSGRAMLFFQELFDYCDANIPSMSASQLAVYVYECGRHGLRCKHLLDGAIKHALESRMSFSIEELSMVFLGICRNCSDYSSFISRHIDSQISAIPSLSPLDQLVLLRIVRQQKDMDRFRRILDSLDMSRFSPNEKFNLIYQMKRSKEFQNFPNRGVYRIVETLLNDLSAYTTPQSLSEAGVIVTDITDALDTLASLRIRNDKCLRVWMDFLVERMAEIKYSPVCGLWQAVTDSLGHLRFFHGPWMRRAVDEMASSAFALKSFASFQLIFFTSSLGRLNYYSERVYDSIADVLKDDVKSINDVDMLATLLFPLERAGYVRNQELVDRVIDQTLIIQGRRSGDRNTVRGSIGVLYSSLSLVDRLASDPRTARIAEYIEQHIQPKYLIDGDFERLYRLRCILDTYGGRNFVLPQSVTERKNFAWFEDVENHKRRVDKIATAEGLKRSSRDLVDLEADDGSLVIVENSRDLLLKWKNQDNDRDFDLAPLETSGSAELRKKLLAKRGFSFVRVQRA